MTAVVLLLALIAQTTQDPNGVRSNENAIRLIVPIVVTIEGAEALPASDGDLVPTVRLVPQTDGNAIEAALNSKEIAISLMPGSNEKYRIRVENLPQGYAVKSAAFGFKDLMKETVTMADLVGNSPRVPTYTGRGELQRLIDSIMARQSRVLNITIAPSPAN